MSHQIVFDGNYMMLTDDVGDTCDGRNVSDNRPMDAEKIIDEWSTQYPLDAERAKAELRSYCQLESLLAKIARNVLKMETLEERKMDSLDFHEVSVWGLKEALRHAYIAGRQAATK